MTAMKSVDDLSPPELLLAGGGADDVEFDDEFEREDVVPLLPLGPRNRAPQATLLAADHMIAACCCCCASCLPPHPAPSFCDSQPPLPLPLPAADAARPRRRRMAVMTVLPNNEKWTLHRSGGRSYGLKAFDRFLARPVAGWECQTK
jgi:hypothetical protein